MSENVLKKGVSLEMTEEEYKIWLDMVERENTNSRNVMRRLIRDKAAEMGIELSEGIFADREKGNRLPKSEALPILTSNRAVA